MAKRDDMFWIPFLLILFLLWATYKLITYSPLSLAFAALMIFFISKYCRKSKPWIWLGFILLSLVLCRYNLGGIVPFINAMPTSEAYFSFFSWKALTAEGGLKHLGNIPKDLWWPFVLHIVATTSV